VLSKDKIGDMDFGMYKKIMDEGEQEGLCSIKLSYRGEPLLHPQVAEMVSYAKNKGILDVYFNSNGMLLHEKMALKLLEAGLDRISISVDGTDPVLFERMRPGASFERILKNVDNLMNIREKRGYSHPKIRVQTVSLSGLDLDEYGKFWLGHCDEVAAVDYKDGGNRDESLVDEDWACPQLWQRMTIEWDGIIMPCNNDDLNLLSPGNVKKGTVKQYWCDPIIQRAREAHKMGQSHLVESCNGCPWRTTQIRKKSAA
jgi:radical SAM protein with 4Fe4S-binding SPASM domain